MQDRDIQKATRCNPPAATPLHRVILRTPEGKQRRDRHFGAWSLNNFLLQYQWSDGTPLLSTSTSQLRQIQARQRFKPHSALSKWEAELGFTINPSTWKEIWLKFRGANENMFLWQITFRAIATQRWRFPGLSASDPSTWCTRCNIGVREDIQHCLWLCPQSLPCWRWGTNLLVAVSGNRPQSGDPPILLTAAHILLAQPLPANWQIPVNFWQILSLFHGQS